jgi:hypothetical protein
VRSRMLGKPVWVVDGEKVAGKGAIGAANKR